MRNTMQQQARHAAPLHIAVMTNGTPSAIANAAGDAIRNIYQQAAARHDEVDPVTVTVQVRVHARGIAVVGHARTKGA